MAAAYQTFGLSCPSGGSFYICAGNTTEFLGCCTLNPCANGGNCPLANLKPASFSGDAYTELPPQDCADTRSTNIWWTCKFNKPPFMGCCSSNPCAAGNCPSSDLIPAKLSRDSANRKPFLPSAEQSVTGPATPPPTAVASSSSSSLSSSTAAGASSTAMGASSQTNEGGSLTTGSIIGISVGVGAAALILLAFAMYKCGWIARKRKERRNAPDPIDAPGFYEPKPHGLGEADQYSPYRDSYGASSTAAGSYYANSPRHHMLPKPGYDQSPDMLGRPFSSVTEMSRYSQQPSPRSFEGFHSQGHSRHPSGQQPLQPVHEMDGVDNSFRPELAGDFGVSQYQPYSPDVDGHTRHQQPSPVPPAYQH